MLGLVFIYFIGRYYYKLAENHNRSKWGFAVLGVATYYGGTFAAGALLLRLTLVQNSRRTTFKNSIPSIWSACNISSLSISKNRWQNTDFSDQAIDDIFDSDV
jgi:hypothetical protein